MQLQQLWDDCSELVRKPSAVELDGQGMASKLG
jgi:hypothetical protein